MVPAGRLSGAAPVSSNSVEHPCTMITNLQVASALQAIRQTLSQAERDFDVTVSGASNVDEDYYLRYASYAIDDAFRKLLILLDTLGLQRTYDEVAGLFKAAQTEGFTKGAMGPEEPGLVWASALRSHVNGVAAIYESFSGLSVTQDLVSLLRAANYFLGNPQLFDHPPENEAQLHNRMEGLLRCTFSDLIRKPKLTKAVKSFEPDTGIPSIQALVEYKFLSSEAAVNRIAEEILSDTRGYSSPEWRALFFVIYETRRFKPEVEWNQLLEGTNVRDARAVVLSGEHPQPDHGDATERRE